MRKILFYLTIFFFLLQFYPIGANTKKPGSEDIVREMKDKIGFAQFDWQIIKIMERIGPDQKKEPKKGNGNKIKNGWKTVISPHDDYSYVGYLYPALLKNLKAKTIIMFGVAHNAKSLGLKDKMVFGSYKKWHGPFGPIPVSPVREEIIKNLPENSYTINNKMQTMEHSLEALLPFIQYFNRDITIVPILIPYISGKRIEEISLPLAKVIADIAKKRGWQWGKDFAIAISSDSVHYGDQNWGGKNFAKYGADKSGYELAVKHEHEIINNCLTGPITKDKIKKFIKYTVRSDDYREYKWTWCGRYSIPFGLMTSYYLEKLLNNKLSGTFVGYATSIDHPHIKVDDIKMGITAPANIHHWVGYTAIGYR